MLIPLGFFSFGSGGFIGVFEGNGNFFLGGGNDGTSITSVGHLLSNEAIVTKVSSTGDSAVWQKLVSESGVSITSSNGSVTSTGKIVQGFATNAPAAGRVVTWDSSGNVIWQRNYNFSVSSEVVSDSNDAIYFSSGNSVSKVTSTPAIAWQVDPAFNNNYSGSPGLHFRQSENALYTTWGVSTGAMINKWNASNGSPIWQKGYNTSPSVNTQTSRITTDSSGNVYCTGLRYSTPQSVVIFSTTSSGTIRWTKGLSTSTALTPAGIITDSDGLYVSAQDGANNAYLIKYDLSGNLLWQRVFSSTVNGVSDPVRLRGLSFVSGGLSMSGRIGGLLATTVLPTDGSATGTVTISSSPTSRVATIAPSSLTNSSLTYSEITGTWTNPAAQNTLMAASMTTSNPALPYTKTTI